LVLGPTHHNWTPALERLVLRKERQEPRARANTYEGHPWPGWDSFSIDWWGRAGRGDPIPDDVAHRILWEILENSALPPLRHWIYKDQLWTSFGGLQPWHKNDHKGKLRHLHLTFWPH